MLIEDLSQLLDSFELGDGYMSIWCGRTWLLEYVDDFIGRFDDDLGWGLVRHLNMLGKEFNRVSDAFGSCLGDVRAIASVVFHRRSEVPPLDSIGIPGASLIWFLVDEDLGAGGCHGRGIVIESSFQDVMC